MYVRSLLHCGRAAISMVENAEETQSVVKRLDIRGRQTPSKHCGRTSRLSSSRSQASASNISSVPLLQTLWQLHYNHGDKWESRSIG